MTILCRLELEDPIPGAKLEVQCQGAKQVLKRLVDALLVAKCAQAGCHWLRPAPQVMPGQCRSTPAGSRCPRECGRWSCRWGRGGFVPRPGGDSAPVDGYSM